MSKIGGFIAATKEAWGVFKKSSGWFNMLGDSAGPVAKLKDAYKQSVWVRAAIRKISGPIASVSMEYSLDRKSGEALEEHPAISNWMRRPAVNLSWFDFVEATVGWLKLKGIVYWIMDDSWLVPHPDVATLNPLIVARPDRMHHVLKDGKLVGWEYRDSKGEAHILLPEQVVTSRFWNPNDEYEGQGDVEAVKLAAEGDYLSALYLRNLMRNNGDQGVYIIAKNGITDITQRDQIIAQLKEKRRRASRGEQAHTFLTADVTIEEGKAQVPDAAFYTGRVQNRHEIFIGLGVPASMADVQASYSIGSASDRFQLIEETCMPLSEKIADMVDQVVSHIERRPVFSWFNWDDHSTMQAVRSERIASAETLFSKGMPMEKISEYLNLALPEYNGWDKGYLPFGLMEVGSSDYNPPSDTDDFSEEEDDVVEEIGEAAGAMLRALAKPTAKAEGKKEEESEDFQDKRDKKEVSQWNELMIEQKKTRKGFMGTFGRLINDARKETLANLARLEVAKTADPKKRVIASDILFNLADWKSGLVMALRNVSAKAMQNAGDQVTDELATLGFDAFSLPAEFVEEFLRSRSNFISNVADSVYKDIQDELVSGINAGETMAQLGGRVKRAFKGANDARALTIAKTETTQAYGAARSKSMQQAGVTHKKWLTSGNGNVRKAHAAANGQVVGANETFKVAGEELMHPGDSDHGASAGNTINCHCISIPTKAPNE